MNSRRSSLSTLGALILSATITLSGLGGCAQTQLAAHVMKSSSEAPAPNGGEYKVGRPYQVNGTTYYPQVDPTYRETGIASWYGADFHGKPTANGDIYDMNALTAAHKTLPMPSTVRVTNLENGRSMILTVNDRGPFVKDRVIDVSRRAAQLLGFRSAGTARVRVEVISGREDSAAASLPSPTVRATSAPAIRMAVDTVGAESTVLMTTMEAPVGARITTGAVLEAPALAAPSPVVAAVASVAPVATEPASEVARGWFVQGGAFRNRTYAEQLSRRLSRFGPTRIKPVVVDGATFYRVRVGPVYDQDYATKLLAQVVDAGHNDASLIID